MSQQRPRTRRIILVGLAVVAVGALVGVAGLRLSRSEDLDRLFDGPASPSPGPSDRAYAGVRYVGGGYSGSDDNALRGGAVSFFDADAEGTPSSSLVLAVPSVYAEKVASPFLTVMHPFEGAVFPPNLCPPFIEWTDRYNDLWKVSLEVPARSLEWSFIIHDRRAQVPRDVWRSVVESSGDSDVLLRVRGVRRGGPRRDVHVSQTVRFHISKDPVDHAVVYRLVAPPFANMKTPDTYVRDVRTLEVRPFVGSHRRYCINCHTFSDNSGTAGHMSIQVRYMGREPVENEKSTMGIADLSTGRTFKTSIPSLRGGSTFMSWSPDGKKLAFCPGHSVSAVRPCGFEALVTIQKGADIAIYDVEKGTVRLLEGASDPDRIELYPAWTPDGERIVFASAPGGLHSEKTLLDLYVVDAAGGAPEPVAGASNNGFSNYYPRFSPDGKWMSFNHARGGSFIKSSSDIWLMPSTLDAPPRPLASNAPQAADSWHSWSSNSRWIAFASKRDDGVFARVYFTHIDESGNASVPVRLPIASEPLASFNVPELVREIPPIDEPALFDALRIERPTVLLKPVEGGGP